MSVKVIITIDTEEDQWDQYCNYNTTVYNIERIGAVQEVFERHGAIPTYLVSYAVATNKLAVRLLRTFLEKGSCEIGSHCHPWNTPPISSANQPTCTMLCDLSPELIQVKMHSLHQAIVNGFRVSPICFRAGRWGFNSKVAEVISEMGYQIDTSITPFINWSEYGGPDFTDANHHAYRFDPRDVNDMTRKGKLIEIPPTIGFFQKRFNLCRYIMKKMRGDWSSRLHVPGILDRLHLLNLRWLSPELSTGPEMIRLSRTFVNAGCQYLNFTFHSTSLLPGKSPFVRDESQLSRFLSAIELFLSYAKEQGMSFVPLSHVIDVIRPVQNA